MAERGIAVDHGTLYRCVQRYAPKLEKRVRWYQGYRSSFWRVHETYVSAVDSDYQALRCLPGSLPGFGFNNT
jgi:transposase-like protein